jgi:hypothetical protein
MAYKMLWRKFNSELLLKLTKHTYSNISTQPCSFLPYFSFLFPSSLFFHFIRMATMSLDRQVEQKDEHSTRRRRQEVVELKGSGQ